jgi:hypothetical protein
MRIGGDGKMRARARHARRREMPRPMSMRRCAGWLLLLCVAAPAWSETWYVEQVAAGERPLVVTHLWAKGAWLRSEVVFFGHPIQTFVRGDRYVIVDALLGTGVSIQRSPRAVAADAAGARPFAREHEQLLRIGGERVREERIGNGACTLFRASFGSGSMEVCVAQPDELPTFVRYYARDSQKSAETRYVDWQKGLELRDDFFAPDPRVALQSYTYEAYVAAVAKGPVGPAPPLHAELLHGPPQ